MASSVQEAQLMLERSTRGKESSFKKPERHEQLVVMGSVVSVFLDNPDGTKLSIKYYKDSGEISFTKTGRFGEILDHEINPEEKKSLVYWLIRLMCDQGLINSVEELIKITEKIHNSLYPQEVTDKNRIQQLWHRLVTLLEKEKDPLLENPVLEWLIEEVGYDISSMRIRVTPNGVVREIIAPVSYGSFPKNSFLFQIEYDDNEDTRISVIFNPPNMRRLSNFDYLLIQVLIKLAEKRPNTDIAYEWG